MIRTVLLTGTRAPATLDLARRLWSEGVRVVGADSLHLPLGRFSRAFSRHYRVPSPRDHRPAFLRTLAEIARNEQVDLIWPTCEEVLHVSVGREALSSVASVFCPPLADLERLHHKLRFADWTLGLGTEVVAPESHPAHRAPPGGRWIWKPNYSRFAARTRHTPPKGDLQGWMAQRFVDGREFSSFALCVEGEIGLLTQYTSPARSGRGAGCAFEPFWSTVAADFSTTVARSLRYTGALAFDFIESDAAGGTFVLECNPRLTSGIHLLDPSVSIVQVLLGRVMPLPPPQSQAQLFLPTLLSSPRWAGSSPDVIARPDDPGPAAGQFLTLGEFAWRAVSRQVPILEATTCDIEYDGL